MVFLLLAIFSSTLVSVFMRLSEKHVHNTAVMFLANYAVCSLVGYCFMDKALPLLPGDTDGIFAFILGIFGGTMFLVSLMLYKLNIRQNGVVLSALFMKLGLLVPMAMAMLIFREVPGIWQLLGFLLAVAAIVVINRNPGGTESTALKGAVMLVLLLLGGGLADSFTNIYDELGHPAWKDHFLFYIFLSAGMICLAAELLLRRKIRPADVLYGMLVGVPNYFSSRFLLLALRSVPAIVAYPVYNVSTIVLISLAGVLFFRERLNRQKYVGIAMILAALVLLNI